MGTKFVVLTYHRVLDAQDPLQPDVCHRALFADQLRTLRRFFNVLLLPDAVRLSRQNRLPRRSVCITFDDGYRDNFEIALPMLRDAGLSATFFVATGYLNDGIMWNDQVYAGVRQRQAGTWDLSDVGLGPRVVNGVDGRRALAEELIVALKHREPAQRAAFSQTVFEQGGATNVRIMMTEKEVRALADAGMAIGAHTVTHPILNCVADDQARNEIEQGRQVLQAIAGQDVATFAYPNGKPGGDYDARHADMARDAGFEAAFSTQWGYASPNAPPFEQPRIGLERERGWGFGARLAKAFWEPPAAR